MSASLYGVLEDFCIWEQLAIGYLSFIRGKRMIFKGIGKIEL